jgi:hypothetical protein
MVFGKHTPHEPSPEGSEYHPTSNNADEQSSEEEKGNEKGRTGIKESVNALQQIYAGVLPLHLRAEERSPGRQARRTKKWHKLANRKPVNLGDSCTTKWRWRKALVNAAKGCKSLDSWVVREVCVC